jgi:glycosyltransferase involved in cell wall biosynthesis
MPHMTSGLNIVILNDYAHVEGGASQVALRSAMGLAARGHRVTVLAAVGPVMPELAQCHVKVLCMGQAAIAEDPNRLRAAGQGLWNPKAGRQLAQLLEQADAAETVVHLHGWTKALSSSVVRATINKGVKVVCTLHDYFTACPNGGYFHYPRQTICLLQGMSPACIASNCDKRSYAHKLWRVIRQWGQRRYGLIPGGIDAFIAPSYFSRDVLAGALPASASVQVISNPVDGQRHDPAPVETNRAFVMVGRLSPEKGPQLFAQAAETTGCEAVFVGDGECRDVVLAICLSARVTGWLPRPHVKKIIQDARALVCPSLCYETQVLAVLEAAAQGVPTIVSDRSAGREAVIDEVTGLWFRSGDVDDLAAKMSVLNDNETVRRMGKAAYERYWANPCSLDTHVAQLEKVYRCVLNLE